MSEIESESAIPIPTIDLSSLDPAASPGSDGWRTVRAQVMQALESHGFFQAVYNKITLELTEALFGTAAKELFALPAEAKTRNISNKPGYGYIGQIPGFSFESFGIDDPQSLESAQRFTNLMWPQGNPNVSETLCSFGKPLSELELMVRRMIMESLGVGKYFDAQNKETAYILRFSEYGAPGTSEARRMLPEHRDSTTVVLIYQHQIEGLEVCSRNDEWIKVKPLPNSVTVICGEILEAWSNGRLPATNHRVAVGGKVTRYSAIVSSHPKDDYIVRVPEELVDAEHPLLYKPFDYFSYVKFRQSDAGRNAAKPLEEYCGLIGGENRA